MGADAVYERKISRDMRDKLRDADLSNLFKRGEENLESGVSGFHEQMRKLAQLIRKSLNDRQTNPAILARRYGAIMHRMEAVDRAVFDIRRGYADIWEALEAALDDSPVKALSERARTGGKAKALKSPQAPMKVAIKSEWEQWQADRNRYRYPRDFRRAMMLKFPEAVDGTLKNWMSEWGREK